MATDIDSKVCQSRNDEPTESQDTEENKNFIPESNNDVTNADTSHAMYLVEKPPSPNKGNIEDRCVLEKPLSDEEGNTGILRTDNANYAETQSDTMKSSEQSQNLSATESSEHLKDTASNSLNLPMDHACETIVEVDRDIWHYLLKSKTFAPEFLRIKDDLNIEVEEIKDDRLVLKLKLLGPDAASIAKAEVEIKDLFLRLKNTASTLCVPCPNNKIFSKIFRLLKQINKHDSYVSAVLEVIRVTGTPEEVKSCLEKLEVYGLQYELPIFEPPVEPLPELVNKPKEPSPFHQTSTENSRLIEVNGLFRPIPFPVEKHLWRFIEERRQSHLQSLKEAFDVSVLAEPTTDPASLNITIFATIANEEVLDNAEEALNQLLFTSGSEILVVVVLQTSSASCIPHDLLLAMQSEVNEVDAILEVVERQEQQKSICEVMIIGTEPGVKRCHNRITAMLQKDVGSDIPKNLGQLTVDVDDKPKDSKTKCLLDTAKVSPPSQNLEREESPSMPIDDDQEHLNQWSRIENETLENIETNKTFQENGHSDHDYIQKKACHGSVLCSVCKVSSDEGPDCGHVMCLSCIKTYFDLPKPTCPVCGDLDRFKTIVTQPPDGRMMITYDTSSRLPGFEKSSRGIIIITYIFKPGCQSEDLPNPGKPYPGLTKTAFLPLSTDGNDILDLLQKAFDNRQTFKISPTSSHPDGELTWNGILHKEGIFGGPKAAGYPDVIYLERVRNDLAAKGIHFNKSTDQVASEMK